MNPMLEVVKPGDVVDVYTKAGHFVIKVTREVQRGTLINEIRTNGAWGQYGDSFFHNRISYMSGGDNILVVEFSVKP